MKFAHKIILLISVPLLFELGFVAVLEGKFHQLENRYEAEAWSHEQMGTLDAKTQALLDVVVFDCLTQVLRDEKHATLLDDAYSRFKAIRLEHNQPGERAATAQISSLQTFFANVESVVDDQWKGRILEHTQKRKLHDLAKLQQMIVKYGAARRELSEDYQNQARAIRVSHRMLELELQLLVAIGAGLSMLLTLWMVTHFNCGTARRFHSIQDSILTLSAGKLLPEPLAPTDEIGEIDTSLYHMSRRLDRAERTTREATAMITHDLRAPLTSLQVMLELFEEGDLGELSEQGAAKIGESKSDLSSLLATVNQLLDGERARCIAVQVESRQG